MPLTNPMSADHLAGAAGQFEPQRSNNFTVEIALGGQDRDLLIMSLQSASLPSERNDEIPINFGNEVRYVAGKASVDPISMNVTDYVDSGTRDAVMRWRKQVYDKETGNVGRAADYKKTADLILMAPDGSSRRVCRLIGVWPVSVSGGQLSFENAGLMQIEVSLRCDKAIWDGGL